MLRLGLVTVLATSIAVPTSEAAPHPASSTPLEIAQAEPPAPVPGHEPARSDPIGGDQCLRGASSWQPARAADELLEGILTIQPWRSVRISRDPRWSIDPFRSPSWLERYHSLLWTEPLRVAYQRTGNEAYRNAWRGYMLDWLEENPRNAPPSPASWGDRSTAVRAQMLACALDWAPHGAFRRGTHHHAKVLAAPSFYVRRSNHALDQNLGLLAAACKVDEQDWIDLAIARIERLVVRSIDSAGGSDEGSLAYALLNHSWYREGVLRIAACKRAVPGELRSRLRALELFITHGATPDGTTPLVGDSWRARLPAGRWPEADHLLTHGASGRAPASLSSWFPQAGWMFDRSSWTDPEATHLIVRTGRVEIHNHPDQGSLVLFGGGRPLLDEGGFYRYGSPMSPRYFVAPEAHNLLLVDGARFRAADAQSAYRTGPGYTFTTLRLPVWQDVSWQRSVLSLEGGRIVLVWDRATSSVARTWRQTWHLTQGSRPAVGVQTAATRFDHGNLKLVWGRPPQSLRLVAGQTWPQMQGWAARGGQMFAAPTLEAIEVGKRFEHLTLLAVEGDLPTARLVSSVVTAKGYRAILLDGDVEIAVAVNGDTVSIQRPPA